MLVSLLEFCAFIFMMFLIFTQIMIPWVRGTKYFPMFHRETKLKDEIIDLNQKIVEKELEQKIKTIKKENGVK